MNKYIRIAFYYVIAALAMGVFYREFTKFNHFGDVTVLGKAHPHLFVLGGLLFLIVSLFARHFPLESDKRFRLFMKLYNIGLPLTVLAMAVRGVLEVLAVPMSRGLDASISGMAGIFHILTGIGLVTLMLALEKLSREHAG